MFHLLFLSLLLVGDHAGPAARSDRSTGNNEESTNTIEFDERHNRVWMLEFCSGSQSSPGTSASHAIIRGVITGPGENIAIHGMVDGEMVQNPYFAYGTVSSDEEGMHFVIQIALENLKEIAEPEIFISVVRNREISTTFPSRVLTVGEDGQVSSREGHPLKSDQQLPPLAPGPVIKSPLSQGERAPREIYTTPLSDRQK